MSNKPTLKTHPQLQDATEPYEFPVELGHVKGATLCDVQNCAGARALKALPDVKEAWVRRTTTIIEFTDGRVLRYRNPTKLTRAVENFDAQSVKAGLFPPGTYTLRPHCPSQRLVAQRRKGKNQGDGSRPHLTRERPAYALR